MFLEDVSPDILSLLPEWTEDSFAGILLNVAAGRVANRFDLGGVNYTVDAACASSLAAVYLASRELESGTSDMVIVGGADTVQNPFAYLCFSKTRALSPRGQCRTFDESADGIVISEGVAVLVLKRLADAERDGDRIYAVVKAVAGSSDGRAKGLTAPRPEGQVLALERAYAKAGFSPASVGLIEAHGTGTVAGDEAEVETLKRVFRAAGAVKQSCAIGSVKSMIGHTKCTAGVAGLIKVALALHDRVLPPTANVEKPNRKAGFPESPFYINTEARPWIQAEQPRRAGVSAFGFGGTNFHAVVEEYTGNFLDSACQVASQCRSSELLLWAGNSRQEILSAIEPLEQALARGAKPALRDLAYTLWQLVKERSNLRLSVVATSLDDLKQKLVWSRQALTGPSGGTIHDPRGIYFTQEPLAGDGKIACLFPGQGSQYPGMLRDLSIYFPEVREQFELADRVLADRLLEPLSTYVFPPPSFSPEEQVAREQALTQTSIAQPALGAAGLGLFRLLQALGLRPDMVAGHSYGEYVALCSADVFSEEVLYRLSEARGRCIIEAAGEDLGTMAAVTEGWERIDDLLKPIDGVWIANANSPRQTVISGTRQGVGQAIQLLEAHSIQVRPIPVACAFHSPVVAGARDKLAAVLSRLAFGAPQLEVFSNSTASPYPAKPEAIGALLAEHLVKPVRFASQVEAMYRAGARIFVEAGPRNILTSLVDQVLGDRDHLAVALDGASRAGLLQLHHALGQLATHGALLKLDRFYQGGFERQLNLEALEGETGGNSPATWLVNGGGARPIREARAPNEPVDSSSPKEGTGHAKPQPLPDVTVASTPSPVPAINGNTTTSPPAMGETEQPARRSAPSLKTTASVQTHVIPGALNQSAPSAEAGSVILQFQRLMNRFLETQQQVMLAYLQKNGDKPALSLPQLSSATASNISTVPNLRPTDIETVLAPSMAPIEQALPVPLLAASAATALDRGTPDEPLSVKEVQHSAGKEPMTRKLLQIVSERTGYPTEMLDLDLNLEADLGIDSIKRVEILGAFQRVWAPADQQMAGEVMEKLTGMKTLRSIVDSISANLLPNPADRPGKPTLETQSEPASQEVFATSEAAVQVPRFLLTAVDAPTPNESLEGVKNPVLVVTDDERGVAKSLIEKLRRQGARAVLVRMDYQDGEVEPDLYRANLADPSAVGKMLDRIRERHGSIAGLIHLLPLKTGTPFEEMDLVCWQDRLRLEVKSLFHLSQAAGPDLKRAVDGEEGWLIAATSMGGAFGIDATKELPFPSQGGVAGLIKTLALEWPSLCSKVVDFVSTDHPSKLAEHLVAEMGARDQEVEVGYRGSRRLVLRATPAPAQQDSPARLGMDANEVVLITGGARGITAEIASELASRYRPTLLLVGRSPLPDPTESALTSGLNSPRDLKAALIDQMRQAGQCVTPAHVEIACSRLLQDREIRANLSTMRQAGATVQYYSVDVRDEHAFGHLIEEIYRLYGRLDGVIHGAGVIEDKLIEDKVPDSFDRVLETKVISAFVLSRKLRPESLKFLVFFSSVAGRFGNRGQSDYAAANEVLNKLAICLDQQWQARVTSINWGPWEKTGMVSREVQRQFAERGVQMITPQAGRRAMDRELRYGKKGEVEVILGAGPWGAVEINRPMSSRLACPLLDGLPLSVGLGGSIEAIYGLDPSKHLYLQDHQLDAKPVLPAAMAMELMAETVQKGWPEWQVVGVRALRVLRGIVLDDGRTSVRVMAKPQTQPSQERLELDVDVEVIELGPDHACYRATVQLAERLPEPPAYKLPSPSGMREFPMTVEDAYRYWLFHGPRLQCISRIDGVDAQGIVATVVPSSPRHCLISSSADQWLIDPIVIDSGPQLAILWARAFKDMTALPSKLQSYRRYGSLSGSSLRCYFQVLPDSTDHTLHASVFFTSSDGHLLGLLEGLESTCSRALNRLTGFSSKAAKGLL
jgi:acyl transferase domain-containing protein/NAD(P)-dependent dehydrogenase (short-subunit alcohol dehydrogenase family)